MNRTFMRFICLEIKVPLHVANVNWDCTDEARVREES